MQVSISERLGKVRSTVSVVADPIRGCRDPVADCRDLLSGE